MQTAEGRESPRVGLMDNFIQNQFAFIQKNMINITIIAHDFDWEPRVFEKDFIIEKSLFPKLKKLL